MAEAHGIERVVIAIDELDKRDAQVVQSALMGSRFFLDLEASFVLTGRLLDVFTDVRSSLLAAFDQRIELGLFTPEESRLIIERNLATARLSPDPDRFRPFADAVVTTIVDQAKGMPRPINRGAHRAGGAPPRAPARRQPDLYVFMADRAEILILDADTITPYLASVRPLRDLLADVHRRQVLRVR